MLYLLVERGKVARSRARRPSGHNYREQLQLKSRSRILSQPQIPPFHSMEGKTGQGFAGFPSRPVGFPVFGIFCPAREGTGVGREMKLIFFWKFTFHIKMKNLLTP